MELLVVLAIVVPVIVLIVKHIVRPTHISDLRYSP
jgi:hypothetical protein